MNKFTYDLKQGWSLDQYIDENEKETLIFCKNDQEEIVLHDDSVKALRELFKRINS